MQCASTKQGMASLFNNLKDLISREHLCQSYTLIILTASHDFGNYTLNRVFNVDFKNHDKILGKNLLKMLQYFKFIFALSIREKNTIYYKFLYLYLPNLIK